LTRRAVSRIRSPTSVFSIFFNASFASRFSGAAGDTHAPPAQRFIEDAHMPAQHFRMEHPRLHAIIHVGREVGDLIGQIDQLRLQRRLLVKEIGAQLRVLGRE
jgi:hypothetical protein